MPKKDGVRFEWDGKIHNYRGFVVTAMAQVAVANAGRNTIKEMQKIISEAGRVDTGELLRSFRLEPTLTALGPTMTVVSDSPYANFVDKGTGIYGPKGSPITRPGGGAMKFNPGRRGAGSAQRGVGRRARTNAFGKGGAFTGSVFATSVRGQTPVNYWEKAQQRMSVMWFIKVL